ncbi:MAG: flagellar protein [Oscillospiraceae bacterium]|nr:flagellar protein [Oscillospiraceae bacterium]
MEVKQCDFCRMPYQGTGNKICGDCLLKLDEDFIEIREYLWEHDRAGIDEVSEATGVSRKSIMYLLKEERLTVGDESEPGSGILTCESCKRPIRTGRMCAGCKNEVMSAMQESIGAVVSKPKRRPEPVEEESFKGVAKLQLKGR